MTFQGKLSQLSVAEKGQVVPNEVTVITGNAQV